MRKFINEVTITGDLVKSELVEKTITTKDGKQVEVITGSVYLRTADKSEFEVRLYTNKFKKDSSEETYFYKEYSKFMEDMISIETALEGQVPSVVTASSCEIRPNDYKSKNTGDVISSTVINGKFLKIESQKEAEIISKEATFTIEGIIGKIEDEMDKNSNLTGNKTVVLYPIRQKTEDFSNENAYEVDEIYEYKCVIEQDLVAAFDSVGYYEGCFVELTGKMVNTMEVKTEVIQQAFGAPIEKKKTTIVKKNVVKSGSNPSTIYDVELPEDAEVVDCHSNSVPHGVFRSNKIIISNPRTVTDDIAMELYLKSDLPEKSYYKAMAGCAVRGYMNTALKIFEDEVNKENVRLVTLEFEDFCCLFKSNEDKELFKQTFSNGFKKDEDNKDISYAFHIYTTK